MVIILLLSTSISIVACNWVAFHCPTTRCVDSWQVSDMESQISPLVRYQAVSGSVQAVEDDSGRMVAVQTFLFVKLKGA